MGPYHIFKDKFYVGFVHRCIKKNVFEHKHERKKKCGIDGLLLFKY